MSASAPSKRLVFCASPGRSGTAYLTELLTGLPHTVVAHEPEPHFAQMLPEARYDAAIAREFLEKRKLPAIKAEPGNCYVETSHYFTKGYVEPMLALGVVPDLIVLARGTRAVAKSWFLFGASMAGALENKASRRMLGPNEPSFLPAQHWRDWNDYQLCYWYVLESARRASHYAGEITTRGARVFSTTLEALREQAEHARLLRWFNLSEAEILPFLKRDRENIINARQDIKAEQGRNQLLETLDLGRLEAAVREDCGLSGSV